MDRPLSEETIAELLRAVIECVNRKPTRLDVLLAWLQTHDAKPINGGSGTIQAIATETGIHHITVLRHVQSISQHRILKHVFKYTNNKEQSCKYVELNGN